MKPLNDELGSLKIDEMVKYEKALNYNKKEKLNKT